ncbi:antibiotic biosynthesis monooxygenase family protein [Flavobacterium sp. YJ01]|uniref:putative quinol monooxygenase n=1 Tax=unclassified Flavobacterium TaxID=196869 RepID=UPI0023E46054|nr:antibiotic biosynthesis monooxygenase family protein [Flavobacterium sp. YJ01]WET01761.1 antibiotic biosynthesis monooxygenase [Flavobacterium sp. YJ01]
MKPKAYKSIAKKGFTIATSVFLLLINDAKAQNGIKVKTKTLTEMTSKMTMYEVKDEQLATFRKSMENYVANAILSKDNTMAEAFYEQEKPNVLWLIERWNDKKEFVEFSKSKSAKSVEELSKKALLIPSKNYYLKDLEPLTKEQWRKTAKKEDQQLVIMLFVDAKKGTEQNFKDTYHIAMPQFRSEPGVVTYQLSEIDGDETQFVTYEKFRSDEAFQYHLNFPPIKPVIEYLETSIKKPPFQNGLHNLIEFAPLTRE